MGYKEEFIEFMVRSKVLTFGDFTTKSGRKTPYFINTGNYKTGEQIAKLGEFYADSINQNLGKDFDVLYGPAYKGIPLSVAAAIALYRKYQHNIPYCFNRKEKKDHGEGGEIIGYTPKDGERVVIIEDVVTAGTSVRETMTLLKLVADVNVSSLVVSVDRMEKGTGEKTTLNELQDVFGIRTFAIVTIEDIIKYLYNREVDGYVYINADTKHRIKEYLKLYGA